MTTVPQVGAIFNHPCGDLLDDGRREDYMNICLPLYFASVNGNWEAAKVIIDDHPDVLRCSITHYKETPLHIATMSLRTHFVQNLVELMCQDELQLENENGKTAMDLAAIAGNIAIAKILVAKNNNLLRSRGDLATLPIYLAALYRNHDMVIYLYNEFQLMLNYDWSVDDWGTVFLECIKVDFFDITLQILDDHEEVLFKTAIMKEVLMILAKKPEAFEKKQALPIWRRIFNPSSHVGIEENEATQLLRKILKKMVEERKEVIEDILRISSRSPVLFAAAEIGNANFLIELIHKYPHLIWSENDWKQTIFHVAVSHRHKSIYNMLHEMRSMKDMITRFTDKDRNSMLHLVSYLPDLNELEGSGDAFQMQNELLWLREVEAMVPHSHRKLKNRKGDTPIQVFTREHRQLVSEGEAWIKGTISQSMVAAALIATIGFSVAFTIPGGYNQNNGFPIFLHNKAFIIYVIFDAISFILASTSILMFLSILTSTFDQNDFLKSLPNKLMLGQATLFLSILTVMDSWLLLVPVSLFYTITPYQL